MCPNICQKITTMRFVLVLVLVVGCCCAPPRATAAAAAVAESKRDVVIVFDKPSEYGRVAVVEDEAQGYRFLLVGDTIVGAQLLYQDIRFEAAFSGVWRRRGVVLPPL